jgi:DNA-binding GntR family transcriptional regulator
MTPGEGASQYALRSIRDAIMRGDMPPDSRIHQADVAAQLGISRIPVREALRKLEAEGLVVLIPNSGARVARLEKNELVEIYMIREALEPMALKAGIDHITDAQVLEIDLLRRGMDETPYDDDEAILELDRRFHLAAYSPETTPRAIRMIEELWNTTHKFRQRYKRKLGDIEKAEVSSEHYLIVQALRSRDGARAAAILEQHIRRTRLGLIRHDTLELS